MWLGVISAVVNSSPVVGFLITIGESVVPPFCILSLLATGVELGVISARIDSTLKVV